MTTADAVQLNGHIEWGQPQYLYALLLLILCFIGQSLWRRRIRIQQASLGYGVAVLCTSINRTRRRIRALCLWAAMLLACTAAAAPRWGSAESTRRDTGAFLVFAIDCSRSMLARDLYPDRMTAAHRKALDIMNANPGHRIALLPFARIATLRTPFTGDHIAVERMIKDCTPALFPTPLQGTAIGAAVSEACVLLEKNVGSSLAIIIFSDGSDKNAERIAQATADAKKNGVRVYGMFFGDPEREVTLEIDGVTRIMDADKSTLNDLALATGGISVNATTDDQDVQALSQHINTHLTQEDWDERQRVMAVERYQWFLIPAICLFACALCIPLSNRPDQEYLS